MKVSNVMALALGAGMCIGLHACGGHDHATLPPQPMIPSQPSQPMATALSVSDVLGKANAQSETGDPLAVDAEAVTINPQNDEESDPVSVD